MTTKKLEEKILALERQLCNCCKMLPTTDGIPTEAPTNGQTVKVDFSAGIIYYYDSDTNTWESISGGGGFFTSSINPIATPVVQDANFSVYDIDNLDQLNINAGVGGQIILTTEGITGDSSVGITDGSVVLGYTGDDLTYSSIVVSNDIVSLGTTNGQIYLSDGGTNYANPQQDNTKDSIVVLDTTNGKVHLRDAASIGGGALPYYEAILRIEDVGGDLQVTEEITNTFPGTVWSTNSPTSAGAQNGFELWPVGYGITFGAGDSPNLGPQNNMTYAADGTVVQFTLYGNGLDNIGILPSLLTATTTTPSNTAFVGHNFIMVIRHYI